ncbi:hypothetical protein COCVIDRAFT_20221 [Bipolaris victoriae FI3]|uniref:Uncharacterized protein n=1 Tax=Bipolaris victoriae (strain FI3) TaxID=930091 RepID=W7ECU0_BIPV3|nr:hypothetical protein COCVIDRAFT_20221 [Bipolaris victoriae FI3]
MTSGMASRGEEKKKDGREKGAGGGTRRAGRARKRPYGSNSPRLSAQAAMRALDHEEEEGHEEEATLSIEARATKSDQGATWNPTETWPAPARRISAGADHSPAFPTRQPSPLASPKSLPPPEHTVRPLSLSGSPPSPCSLALPLTHSLSLSIPVPHPRPQSSSSITEQEQGRGVALCGPRPIDRAGPTTYPPSIHSSIIMPVPVLLTAHEPEPPLSIIHQARLPARCPPRSRPGPVQPGHCTGDTPPPPLDSPWLTRHLQQAFTWLGQKQTCGM